MANIITNILTINGTTEDVAKVREFIKGANGEFISFQSFLKIPEELNDGLDRMMWKYMHWGTKWDADPVYDEAVDAPNRITFNTKECAPISAMRAISSNFPDVTLNLIFSDEYPGQYAGEYTLTGGAITNHAEYDAWGEGTNDLSEDQVMECYFLTHEYDRENWKKDEDGEWVSVSDDDIDDNDSVVE